VVHRLECVVHAVELEDIPGLLDGYSVIRLAWHATFSVGFLFMARIEVYFGFHGLGFLVHR